MPEESPVCQSCNAMLSDASLIEQSQSEEGLNISQTAEGFFAAVDHGCAICTAIHEMASRGQSEETELFRSPPSSSTTSARLAEPPVLVKNIHVEILKPGTLDVQSVRIALWSAENRYNFDVEFVVYTEAGEAIAVAAFLVFLIWPKTTLLLSTSTPVQSI